MKKLIAVEAKSMLDIRNKELLYLIVGEFEKQVIINVGQKTFDSVKDLIEKTGRQQVQEVTNIKIAEPEKK